MKKIDYAKIIKEKIKISDIIGKDVNLIVSGTNIKALCPFHKEKTPSFVINDLKGTFNCFGCGIRGDVFNYIMEKYNVEFKEALKIVASFANVDLNIKNISYQTKEKDKLKRYQFIMQYIADFYHKNLLRYLDRNRLEILEKKKINNNLVKKFKIGLSSDAFSLEKYLNTLSIETNHLIELGIFKKNENGSIYDLFKNRLMFPILDRLENVIAFGGRKIKGEGPKYINSWENDFFKKRQILYNLNNIKDLKERNDDIFLVEGYTDVIALSKIGKFAVAPLGTSISLEQIEILWKYADEPSVLLDGDRAGKMAAKRLLEITIPHLDVGKTLNFILLSENLDPDDILNSEGGTERFLNILNNKANFLDTLFYFEKKVDLNTPERLLGIKKRLFSKLEMIKNIEIRRLYKVFLNEKLNSLFKKSMKNVHNKYENNKDRYFVNFSKNKSVDRFVLRRERSIILAMINNFKLLQGYDEQLAKFPLSNSELSSLRDIIIETITTGSITSSSELKEILLNKGFSNLIKKHFVTEDCINFENIEKHARENTNIADAGKVLMDLINIQEEWYNNRNKNLSKNFVKL